MTLRIPKRLGGGSSVCRGFDGGRITPGLKTGAGYSAYRKAGTTPQLYPFLEDTFTVTVDKPTIPTAFP